jgi:hypothetical protein
LALLSLSVHVGNLCGLIVKYSGSVIQVVEGTKSDRFLPWNW